MSLTLRKRLEVYEEALKFLQRPNRHTDICTALFRAQVRLQTGYHSILEFPEILEHRPEHISKLFPAQQWFPENEEGTRKRVLILQAAINKIKSQVYVKP